MNGGEVNDEKNIKVYFEVWLTFACCVCDRLSYSHIHDRIMKKDEII